MKTPFGTIAVGAEAKAKINRKDFGLNWNKPLESRRRPRLRRVNIDINLELSKKAPLKAEK